VDGLLGGGTEGPRKFVRICSNLVMIPY